LGISPALITNIVSLSF